MESTGGLGREAEVWVDGQLLTVCDGISPAGRRLRPGPLEGVRLAYLTAEGFSWEQAAQGNRARKRALEPEHGWRYVGYGCVVEILPVLVDYGLLTMEDANWTTDERLVGRFVRVPIDRLEIVPAHEPDFP